MAFCSKCGTQVDESAKFCPSCGASTEIPKMEIPKTEIPKTETTQQNGEQTNFSAKIAGLNNTEDSTAQFDPQDIQNNKAMAILAYIGFLVLIPLFAAKGSKFARYHTNQGIVLCLTEIAYGIVYNILSSIIFAISWRLYFLVKIIGIFGLVFFVLLIIGIINASNGRAKELPVIGKFKILK